MAEPCLKVLRNVFDATELPRLEDIEPGITPRMQSVRGQQRFEADGQRPWPRRRFETIRFEELCRLNRLLDVSPEAARAWKATNRTMLVVDIRQDGHCWTARASLWEAPSEAAFMRADDGAPAPPDEVLFARRWRRVGGTAPETEMKFFTHCPEHGICTAVSSAVEIDGGGWGVEGLVHLVPSANQWRMLDGICKGLPYRRLPCNGPAPIYPINEERRDREAAPPKTSDDD